MGSLRGILAAGLAGLVLAGPVRGDIANVSEVVERIKTSGVHLSYELCGHQVDEYGAFHTSGGAGFGIGGNVYRNVDWLYGESGNEQALGVDLDDGEVVHMLSDVDADGRVDYSFRASRAESLRMLLQAPCDATPDDLFEPATEEDQELYEAAAKVLNQ